MREQSREQRRTGREAFRAQSVAKHRERGHRYPAGKEPQAIFKHRRRCGPIGRQVVTLGRRPLRWPHSRGISKSAQFWRPCHFWLELRPPGGHLAGKPHFRSAPDLFGQMRAKRGNDRGRAMSVSSAVSPLAIEIVGMVGDTGHLYRLHCRARKPRRAYAPRTRCRARLCVFQSPSATVIKTWDPRDSSRRLETGRVA